MQLGKFLAAVVAEASLSTVCGDVLLQLLEIARQKAMLHRMIPITIRTKRNVVKDVKRPETQALKDPTVLSFRN